MGDLMVRAIRGAITVEKNTRDDIEKATRELLESIIRENELEPERVISVFFTLTPDLNAGFPAAAARQLRGWQLIPMLCAREVAVPGQLPMCIRVMIHSYTSKTKEEIKHVYLRRARALRPDLD